MCDAWLASIEKRFENAYAKATNARGGYAGGLDVGCRVGRRFLGDLAGDTRALDEFHALSKKFDEAIDRRDAAAVAALFTEDGVFMTPTGVSLGAGR